MRASAPWIAAALGAALALPPPGTGSRERRFCPAWSRLAPPAREAVLREAEARESPDGVASRCRAGLRSGLRHTLDWECERWPRLMDFEVRDLVDRVLASCLPGDA